MSISEFAVHNVLRTYSRQERLGGVHKAKAKSTGSPRSADQVNLSSTGRKIQWIGTLAAEVVARQHPELDPEDRPALVRTTKEQLLGQHEDEIGADGVSPEALETRLRPLYLD